SSINRAGSETTGADSVNFTVNFSEDVFFLEAADFALVGSGAAGASISGITGGDDTYTVSVSTAGSGTLGLNFVDRDTVMDIDEVPIGGTGTNVAHNGI